jgi:CRP-like cAMP-binding protein
VQTARQRKREREREARMTIAETRPGPGRNRLVQALPLPVAARLRAADRPAPLVFGQVVGRAEDPIDHVYFPDRGMVSLLVRMADGRGVDAATVGFEGMVGVPLVLGEAALPYEAIVQADGEALQIPTASFRSLLAAEATLQTVLQRYIALLLLQAARSAACNRLHPVEARLARWLLHTHDRVGAPRLRLTHDFLGAMLGVRRASVTMAAGGLQQAGVITYRRGEITIRDRSGLEAMACEDYFVIRDAFERLLTGWS